MDRRKLWNIAKHVQMILKLGRPEENELKRENDNLTDKKLII